MPENLSDIGNNDIENNNIESKEELDKIKAESSFQPASLDEILKNSTDRENNICAQRRDLTIKARLCV